MNLTHRARSLLAGPRRELVGVLALMAFALAVLGMQSLCGVHPDERAAGAGHSHEASAGAPGFDVAAADAVVEVAAQPLGADPHCADHSTVTTQSDPVRTGPQGPAVLPDLAVRWLVPPAATHQPAAPSGLAVASAPSLHALGISRT